MQVFLIVFLVFHLQYKKNIAAFFIFFHVVVGVNIIKDFLKNLISRIWYSIIFFIIEKQQICLELHCVSVCI